MKNGCLRGSRLVWSEKKILVANWWVSVAVGGVKMIATKALLCGCCLQELIPAINPDPNSGSWSRKL